MLQGPLPQSAAAAGWPTGHTPTFNIYCRWPTGHAPTFNIYCRWPTGHAPTFLAHILQVAHRARPYSSSSGSQQGYPTCIPPLTTALLTTRGVLCQRHSPECNYTLPQTITLGDNSPCLYLSCLFPRILLCCGRGGIMTAEKKRKEDRNNK